MSSTKRGHACCRYETTSTSGIDLSSDTRSTSPSAATGPNNGFNTPTNVLALTGVHRKAQHKARAIDLFFTCHIPPRPEFTDVALLHTGGSCANYSFRIVAWLRRPVNGQCPHARRGDRRTLP